MELEKNDVDISKLFIWGKEFEITDSEGKVEAKVYMRLLGDADVNRARVYALRKSREFRLQLADENSDERMIYVRKPEELSRKELMGYITMFSIREITERAFKEVKVTVPKMPKAGAPLKKMEQYQKELDEYPQKLQEAVKQFTKKETAKLEKDFEGVTDEELYKKYVELLIEEFCEQEALRAYNDMELFLGCYKDEDYKERLWEDYDRYDNLPTEIKIQFRAAYESLKIKMDELKKLRAVTQ